MDPMTERSEMQRLMDEAGFTEDEARFILAHQYGPNQGDVKTQPPMTRDEWRRRGLGMLAEPTVQTARSTRRSRDEIDER
jgi:hypothetical protein